MFLSSDQQAYTVPFLPTLTTSNRWRWLVVLSTVDERKFMGSSGVPELNCARLTNIAVLLEWAAYTIWLVWSTEMYPGVVPDTRTAEMAVGGKVKPPSIEVCTNSPVAGMGAR